MVGEEGFERSLEECEDFYMQSQRKDSEKGNIGHKVWSWQTQGKCLRNCADSDFGKNKESVLGGSKRENQKVNRDHVVGGFKFQGMEFVII